MLHLTALFTFPPPPFVPNNGVLASANSESTQTPIYVLPFSLAQISPHQTLLQLLRCATMLPSTWPLLRGLYSHRHPRPGTQSTGQTQAIGQEHTHFSCTFPPILTCHQHRHPIFHIPPSILPPVYPDYDQAWIHDPNGNRPYVTSRPRVGSSADTVLISSLASPTISDYFVAFTAGCSPRTNPYFAPPTSSMLSASCATSANTLRPPSKQRAAYAQAATATLRSMPHTSYGHQS